MSIENKLIYLNGTKEKLKDSINALGGDITSETTFRNYVTELDNIYSSLPKTTGEGSNLSLTTLKGRINVEAVKGDTQQNTYEGYNLLPNYRPSTQTLNQMKQTKNDDGSIIFAGTTNAYTQFVDSNSITLPSGSYSLFVKTDNASNYVTGQIRSADGLTTITTTSTRSTFTLTEATEVKYRTVITSGITLSNYELKPMVYSGTTAKTWEPYTNGASPNPTYPQDINVVTGTQEVVVQNKNIYDSSYRTPDNTILCAGGTCTEENGVFTIQATRNDMYVWNVQSNGSTYSAYQNQLIDFTENTYTITITNALFTKNFITFYDKDKKVLNFKQFNANIFTFTKGQDDSVPSTAKYFTLRFGIQESVSGTTYTTSVQIEVGSTATPYTPHQEQTKTLHLSSKNLLDQVAILTPASNVGIAINSNGNVYDTSPTGDNRTSSYANSNWQLKLPSGTYAISFNFLTQATNSNAVCHIYNSSNTLLLNGALANKNSYSGTFTLAEETEIGIFSKIYDGVVNIMLNEGSTALPYEPYYNYELSKIGTYQDRIFETSGKQLFNGTLYNGQVGSNGGWTSNNTRVTNIRASGVYSDLFLEKGTYTLNIPNLTQCTLLTKNASGTILDNFANSWNNLPFTFTLTQDGYLSFTGRKETGNLTPSDYVVMLSKGSTALPYEPYGSDKWYIEKKFRKLILNGSEAWNSARGTSPYVYTVVVPNYMRTNEVICMSNYFKGVANGTYGSMTNNEIKFRYYTDTNKDMYICSSDFTTLADFKTWLGTHNTEVRYVLDTPTYEEITNETLLNELNELEKMMSYNGQTNISVSGNLPMILDVTALKGE